MDYEVQENSIVERLRSKIDSGLALIMPIPDNLSDYAKAFVNAKIHVMFTGEKVDDNQSTDEVSQHSTLTFNISVMSRLLRGSIGVYQVSELVKMHLIGFRLPNCGRMSYVSQEFTNQDMDVWEHTMVFSARTLRVQEIMEDDYPDDTDILPTLVTVNHGLQSETIYNGS